MNRPSTRLVALPVLLAGCVAEPVSIAPTGVVRAVPDGVRARLAAEARAIHGQDEGFVAELSQVGLTARFDAEGASFAGRKGDVALRLHTAAWGRSGSMATMDGGRAPALGDCVAESDASGRCLRRLELADATLTEWWVGLGNGVEQGWTLEAAPAGEGPLVFEVAIEGALAIDATADGASVTDADGRAWNVAQVVAWDARGEPLPATLSVADDRVRIVVDDRGAAYPVTVDPVYETAAWTASGDDYSWLGYSLDSAGDVNGDGFGDVIVGAPYARSRGRAYLYTGSTSGLSTIAATVLEAEALDDAFGHEVAGAGDVDGDGYDDVLVTAPGHASGAGRTYLFRGSPAGLVVGVPAAFAEAGPMPYAIAGAGDVDDDGYDDVIVGAPGHRAVYLYRGSAAGLETSSSCDLLNAADFGGAVAAAGDVNGDGYADVIVGAASPDGARAGRAFVFTGSAMGLSTSVYTYLVEDKSGPSFGGAVAGAGDVNGDGYDDVIVAAPEYASSTGHAYVYEGSANGLATSASTVLWGDPTSGFATAVDGAGDVNADGYDDVIIGAPESETVDLYLGSANGLPYAESLSLTVAEYLFGSAVSGAGDVDGDGADDVLVGTWTTQMKNGSAYLFEGYAIDQDGDGIVADDDCDDRDPAVALEPVNARYRDADGDGLGDPANSALVCTRVPGYVDNADDCDDANATIGEAGVRYTDTDGDGHGDAAMGDARCPSVPGYVISSDDCDDSNPNVGGPDMQFRDTDGDGYGDALHAAPKCPGEGRYVPNDDDCNDSDPSIGAVEGGWFRDVDGDGHGDPDRSEEVCPFTYGYVRTSDDCDDQNPEVGAGNEQFLDADGDGFGDPAARKFSCHTAAGYVANAADCDDASADVNPDAEDVGGDDVDQNCSGAAAELLGFGCSTVHPVDGAGLIALLGAALVRRRRASVRPVAEPRSPPGSSRS